MAKKVKDDGSIKGSTNLPTRPDVSVPQPKANFEKSKEAKNYAGILKSGMSK
jgi:hypothetical protein